MKMGDRNSVERPRRDTRTISNEHGIRANKREREREREMAEERDKKYQPRFRTKIDGKKSRGGWLAVTRAALCGSPADLTEFWCTEFFFVLFFFNDLVAFRARRLPSLGCFLSLFFFRVPVSRYRLA